MSGASATFNCCLQWPLQREDSERLMSSPALGCSYIHPQRIFKFSDHTSGF
uniref:Uncharacterized protein n=1 Tax=Nothobranchius furzeri TaxID=105023 RepID=A0A8C6K6M3_NOTFU